MLTGENGILTKATQAQSEHEDATVKEAIALAYNEYQIIINETTGKVIEDETKIASTTQVKIEGQEEKHLATPSMSYWDFLKDEKQYIDKDGVINVKTLVGEKLNKGNGTGDNDVYKIVKEREGYVLKYCENSEKQTALWEIETVSNVEIFVYDETEDGIEIVGLDFTKLEYEKTETEYGKTLNENYNMLKIGEYFQQILEQNGYPSNQLREYYDIEGIEGAYDKSEIKVKEYLEKSEKKEEIIFDVHRDAAQTLDKEKNVIEINGKKVAKLRFVIGTNHKDWEQNLQWAVKIQKKADEIYPGLFEPMLIDKNYYNQNLGKYETIIEVGIEINNLEEEEDRIEYLL